MAASSQIEDRGYVAAIDVHLNKSIINIHPQLNRSTTSKLKTPSITTINAKKYSTIAEKLF